MVYNESFETIHRFVCKCIKTVSPSLDLGNILDEVKTNLASNFLSSQECTETAISSDSISLSSKEITTILNKYESSQETSAVAITLIDFIRDLFYINDWLRGRTFTQDEYTLIQQVWRICTTKGLDYITHILSSIKSEETIPTFSVLISIAILCQQTCSALMSQITSLKEQNLPILANHLALDSLLNTLLVGYPTLDLVQILSGLSNHEQDLIIRLSNSQFERVASYLTSPPSLDRNLLPKTICNPENNYSNSILFSAIGSGQVDADSMTFSDIINFLSRTQKLPLRTNKKSNENDAEQLLSLTVISISKLWNSWEKKDHVHGDILAAQAIIYFISSEEFKRYPCNSACMTAATAIAMRLLMDAYVPAAHTIAVQLLYTTANRCPASHLLPFSRWIIQQLLSLRPALVVDGVPNLGLSVVVHTMISIAADSALAPQAHSYLYSLADDISKEFNASNLQVLLLPLRQSLQWLPRTIIGCQLREIVDSLLHALNLWHLSVHRLVVAILVILVWRVPDEMESCLNMILTEILRLRIFYVRSVIPDISMANSESVSILSLETADLVKTIRNSYPELFKDWFDKLHKEIERQQQDDLSIQFVKEIFSGDIFSP